MNDRLARTVALTGIGVVSPLASGWNDLFEIAARGQASFALWKPDLEPPCEHARLGLVSDYPKARFFNDRQLRLMDRAMALSSVATGLALEDARLSEDDRARLGGEIATVTASMKAEIPSIYRFASPLYSEPRGALNPAHFPMIARNISCGQAAIRFGLKGWSTMLASGEISGMHALTRGMQLVTTGRAQVAVIIAYEALSKLTLHHLKTRWQKYGRSDVFADRDSNEDVPAEGACVFILEDLEHARSRGARPYAVLDSAVHGYLPDDSDKACQAIADKYRKRSRHGAEAADILVSGIGRSPDRAHYRTERMLVCALQQAASGSRELRTRPVFGDAGSLSFMYQTATAAQLLKNQKVEAVFVSEGDASLAAGRRLSTATITAVTDRGAYGILSMEQA